VSCEVGGVWSVEPVAGTSPDMSVAGWIPMSANRFTVACCMFGSGGLPLGTVVDEFQALVLSSPHDH
jgi:hypothetical protein